MGDFMEAPSWGSAFPGGGWYAMPFQGMTVYGLKSGGC